MTVTFPAHFTFEKAIARVEKNDAQIRGKLLNVVEFSFTVRLQLTTCQEQK